MAHAPVFFSRCPALKRAPTTSYSPHWPCGTAHVRPTVRHHDGGIIVVINMMFQIIKIILAIIGIAFGCLFILFGLMDGSGWPVLMGLAFLGPGMWWFVTKPGQRRWKAVIPLALLSFFAGIGAAPKVQPEQPAAAVMATPSSSSTPTTTKKTTTSRPTTTSRTTTSQTTTTTTSAPPTTSTVVSETQVVSDNHTDHYVRDPEPAPSSCRNRSIRLHQSQSRKPLRRRMFITRTVRRQRPQVRHRSIKVSRVTEPDWIVTKTASPANDKFY